MTNYLAALHRDPPEPVFGAGVGDPIRIAYDAAPGPAGDAVFAVIPARDLARLPSALVEDVDFSDRLPDGLPSAFFLVTERGLHLHLETDRHEDRIERILDAAMDRNIPVANGIGFLKAMADPDGNIVAPERPAFVENAARPVTARAGLEIIRSIQAELDAEDADPDPFGHG